MTARWRLFGPSTPQRRYPYHPTAPLEDVAEFIYREALAGSIDPDYAHSVLLLLRARHRLDADIAEEHAQQQLAEVRATLFAQPEEETP